MRDRLERIHRAPLEDPSALSEEGRLISDAILWNVMALTDSACQAFG